MTKVYGLDIPFEFEGDFSNIFKKDWLGTQQKICIAPKKPAAVSSSHLAGRSYIPDFLAGWAALSEAQQSGWLRDWGSGGEQAFALYFQNNYYRQINSLELRSTPNFFTAPAAWLHIAAGDDSVILRFDISSGDYILSDPANIKHLQNRLALTFKNCYTISATLAAKLQNIATPATAICTAKITQYYTGNGTPKSRQQVLDQVELSGSSFSYPITYTFTKIDAVEVVTAFRIDLQFDNAVGEVWFFENTVTAVDSILGVLRFHNVINLEDIEAVFGSHLAGVKNQWSISEAAAGTTLRRVFPYAFGYPEEIAGVNLVINGTFDADLSHWDAPEGWSWDNGTAKTTGNELVFGQNLGILERKLYRLEFDVSNSNNGLMAAFVESEADEFDLYQDMPNGHYSIDGYASTETTVGFLPQGFSGNIDNVKVYAI